MQLVAPVEATSSTSSGETRWETLRKQLGDSPRPDADAMDVDGAADANDGDADLSPLQLADGVLENVNKCPDCGKPVLVSAMEEHAASTSTTQQPKKSKLVLHLSATDAATSSSASTPSATPAPTGKKSKRAVDLDRQCGVINEKGFPCPRSLTCKTHNMTNKRAVAGRSQPFDMLLAEWQKASKAKEKAAAAAAGAEGKTGTASRPGPSATPDSLGVPTPLPAVEPQLHPPPPSHLPLAALPAPQPLGKTKKRKSGFDGGSSSYKLGGAEGGGKKSKKGVVYVGEWEESDDDAGGADELVDSEEEVEQVLRGIGRVERGRPLFIARGGGAGFSAASMFTGRNQRALRLHGVLQDVFRPPG
ncbi:SAGA complex subunit Sgf73 [Rhodosporidiobolus nylandii]